MAGFRPSGGKKVSESFDLADCCSSQNWLVVKELGTAREGNVLERSMTLDRLI